MFCCLLRQHVYHHRRFQPEGGRRCARQLGLDGLDAAHASAPYVEQDAGRYERRPRSSRRGRPWAWLLPLAAARLAADEERSGGRAWLRCPAGLQVTPGARGPGRCPTICCGRIPGAPWSTARVAPAIGTPHAQGHLPRNLRRPPRPRTSSPQPPLSPRRSSWVWRPGAEDTISRSRNTSRWRGRCSPRSERDGDELLRPC